MYTILLPTTYYIALSHEIPGTGSTSNVLSDDTRHQLLVISRGYSVILIIVYVLFNFSVCVLIHPASNSYVLTRVYLYFSAVDGREGNISEILRKYRVTIHKARRTLRVETTTLDATSSSENVDRSEQSREQHPEHVIQRTSSMPKEHILRRIFKTIWTNRLQGLALIGTTVAMAYTAECVSHDFINIVLT